MSVHLTLPILLALMAYYVFAAAAGAMLPPEEGKERTWYGFWFRFIQTLAANSHRLADGKLLPAIARELSAEADDGLPPKPHVIHVSPIQRVETAVDRAFDSLLHTHQAGHTTGDIAPQETIMSTTTTPASSVSELKKVEQEFVSILEKAGQDFEKGLAFSAKYLPQATVLASLLFPAAAAPLTEASVTATLLQNAVVAVEQKYAAMGAQSGTGAQKLADVLTLVNGAVQTLLSNSTIQSELTKAGITVNSTYTSNLVSAVVGFLNVQGVPAAAQS